VCLWLERPNQVLHPPAVANAIRYAQFYSRSHDTVIRVYDEAGNVIETHEHKGELSGEAVRATCQVQSAPDLRVTVENRDDHGWDPRLDQSSNER